MLYLNDQDRSDLISKLSETNSFKTDTSMEGVSVDSNHNIARNTTEEKEPAEKEIESIEIKVS